MGALTEVYVDPSIAANSGSGTIGDPFGDLQHALDNTTRDSTNGDRFNIKAGTDEVMASTISLTTYGTPTIAAPLAFQGYTSAAGDGGIGGISGGGSVSVFTSATTDNIIFRDLHLHNCGSQPVIFLDEQIHVINCEVDNTSGSGVIVDQHGLILGCNIHNIGTDGIDIESGLIFGCYFKNGANSFVNAIDAVTLGGIPVGRCIFSLSGTSNGIVYTNGIESAIYQNSFLSSGTGKAIVGGTNSGRKWGILNNLFEGWATWIDLSADTSQSMTPVFGNAGNGASGTAYDLGDVQDPTLFDNETLSTSPFAQSGTDTYANRETYFAPVDTGNVLSPFGGMGGAKGAIQAAGGGGGGGTTHPLVIARRNYQHWHL